MAACEDVKMLSVAIETKQDVWYRELFGKLTQLIILLVANCPLLINIILLCLKSIVEMS